MPFHFTHFDCEAVGSFVVSKLDIHWIGKIQTLSQSSVLSISASRNDFKLHIKAFLQLLEWLLLSKIQIKCEIQGAKLVCAKSH